MIMKRILVFALTACAVLTASMASAQECAKNERSGCVKEAKYDKMAKELSLTDAQMAEIKAADAKFAASLKEARAIMKTAGNEKDAAYKKILTSEQYAKMKDMQSSDRFKKKHEEMRKGKKICCPDSMALHKGCHKTIQKRQ